MTETFSKIDIPGGTTQPLNHAQDTNVDARESLDCRPILEIARQVLELEAQAVQALVGRLGQGFESAVELILACSGKVVVTGIGKSGHIGCKIAATLASTGTPAFFVHPAELRHGDFGMLAQNDVVIVLSGSGETPEIKLILDPIKRLGLPVIALTGNLTSTLANLSEATIDCGVDREACPLNLAPTSSTTATLAIGDALAIAVMTRKGFRAEDFARSHPGGSLGKQLITVRDVMRRGVKVPKVELKDSHATVLSEIERKKLGFTSVVDSNGKLAGIITDGDLRRALVRYKENVFACSAFEMMTSGPKTISSNSLAVEALKVMETFSISDILIVDDRYSPVGVIHLKDLLKAGVV